MVAAYSRKYGSDNRSIVAERLNSVVMLCGGRVARRLKTVARETRLLSYKRLGFLFKSRDMHVNC